MSQTILIILLIVLILLVLGMIFFKKQDKRKDDEDIGLKLILEQINELNRTVDRKISESTKHMNDSVRNQFIESAKLIKDVTQGLTKLDETNRQVVSFRPYNFQKFYIGFDPSNPNNILIDLLKFFV